jgi:hypothetical protein
MGSNRRPLGLVVAASLAAVGAGAFSAPAAAGTTTGGEQDVRSCAALAAPGFASCQAHVRIDAVARSEKPARPGARQSATAVGNNGAYDPAYLRSAYNLAASGGAGLTVAVVDAYDDPSAAADLAQYRTYFNLPAATFTRVDQRGGTAYPAADKGWAEEISLDLDMVSAICPNCAILLVEADDNSMANLGAAVNRAVAMGAAAVSNSYGGGEYGTEAGDSSAYYSHPGVVITASSGDNGYGVEFPAASSTVTAVGGTTLKQSTSTGTRNATETAWSGAGSGCSAYMGKPSWQKDGGCSRRTVADVSAVADPNTGVWVYDTDGGDPGWMVFGGTSVASPIVASVYALAGRAGAGDTPASYPYANTTALFDITSGSDGSCANSYLCTARTGYDGPTGLGTPNDLTAFKAAAPLLGALSFTSAAQTLSAGAAGGAINVGVSPAPASPIAVKLSSSSGKGLFATSPSGPWSSTLTVPAGSGGAAFYYSDTAAGSPTITATSSGYSSATQVEKVNAGPLATVVLSPSSATISRRSSIRFTAAGQDAYGNAVALTVTPSWSVSPSLGTFSNISGGSATFTAGSSTGSGTVTAAVGSLKGTASISVHR